MCNLYSITTSQAAIIAIARALRDVSGNVPIMPAVFPDYTAPIVRNAADGAGTSPSAGSCHLPA